MGSKTAARLAAMRAGTPVAPGIDHAITFEEAREFGIVRGRLAADSDLFPGSVCRING